MTDTRGIDSEDKAIMLTILGVALAIAVVLIAAAWHCNIASENQRQTDVARARACAHADNVTECLALVKAR